MHTYEQTKNIVTSKRELPPTGETMLHTFDLNQTLPPVYGTENAPTGEFGGAFNTVPEEHKIQYNTGDYQLVICSEKNSFGRLMDTVAVWYKNTGFYKKTLSQYVPTDFQYMVYTLREMLDGVIKETNQHLQEQDRYPEISYHPIRLRVFRASAPSEPFTPGRGIPQQLRLPSFARLLQDYMVANDCSYLDHRVYRNNINRTDAEHIIVAMFHPRPEHLTGMTYLDLFFDVLNKIDERDEERAHRDETWGTETQFARVTEGIARSGIHYLIKNMGRKDEVIREYTSMRELRENTQKIIDLMREFPTIGFVVEHETGWTKDRESAVTRKHYHLLDRIESDFSRLFRTTVVG